MSQRSIDLSPLAIMAIGPPLMAFACTCVFGILTTDPFTFDKLVGTFFFGCLAGIFYFGPIALVEKFRGRLTDMLAPYAYRICWNISPIMAFAGAFAFGSMRDGRADLLVAASWAIVVLGAMIKCLLGTLFDPRSEQRTRRKWRDKWPHYSGGSGGLY